MYCLFLKKMFVLFQYYNHSSQMYSFLFFLLFNLCTVYFTKKIPFFLSCFSICCVQQYSSFFSFFTSALFPLSCTFFVFALFFVFLFFSLFFPNKLLIHCPFFFPTLYLPLSVFYLNTITIGSLPSLFNFNPWYHKLSLVYDKTFLNNWRVLFFLFFFLHKISRLFFPNNPNFY